jgi:hypothetical protein
LTFIAHFAKSLHSTGQVVRLRIRFPQPTAPLSYGRIASGQRDETRTARISARARSLSSARAAPPGAGFHIEECLPRTGRQRCLAHKARNLQSKVPEDLWPEFNARTVRLLPGGLAGASSQGFPFVRFLLEYLRHRRSRGQH